jgi:uncharacterized protein YdcH (DUF465 family)
MSMLATTEAALREYLIANDEHYRDLATEHRRYDDRLKELSGLHYPSEEEQVEETILKKKKLLLKDQMEAIAHKYQTSSSSH